MSLSRFFVPSLVAALAVTAGVFCAPAAHAQTSQLAGFLANTYTINHTGPYTPVVTNGTSAQLTSDTGISSNTNTYQATSLIFNDRQQINNFTASFTLTSLHPLSGSQPADGITFVLHNDPLGPGALGQAGGFLGYGSSTGASGTAVANSAALAFNFLPGYTPGMKLFTNPAAVTAPYNATGAVNLNSTHPIDVFLSYSQANSLLSVQLTDAVANTTYSTSYNVNLNSALTGTTAYVGFTGGVGTNKSSNTISNFAFSGSSGAAAAAPEPGSLSLLGMGLAGGLGMVGTVRRRKSKSSLKNIA